MRDNYRNRLAARMLAVVLALGLAGAFHVIVARGKGR
jgi:hypothetical protein